MADKSTITIEVEKIQALLPGYKILTHEQLWEFHCLLRQLWEQAGKRKIPKDFQQIIFGIEDYFLEYMVDEPSPYNPPREAVIIRLKERLSKTPL